MRRRPSVRNSGLPPSHRRKKPSRPRCTPGTIRTLWFTRMRSASSIAGRLGVISHQAQRAGLRLAKGEQAAETIHPLAHDRQIVLQDGPRAGVQLLAIFRLHGHARHRVGDFVGADGEVIVLRPAFGDHVRRPDDPADADAGNSVSFREAAGDDDAVAHAPETAGAFGVNLGAKIDFVGEQVGAESLRNGQRCAAWRRERARSRTGCWDWRDRPGAFWE